MKGRGVKIQKISTTWFMDDPLIILKIHFMENSANECIMYTQSKMDSSYTFQFFICISVCIKCIKNPLTNWKRHSNPQTLIVMSEIQSFNKHGFSVKLFHNFDTILRSK